MVQRSEPRPQAFVLSAALPQAAGGAHCVPHQIQSASANASFSRLGQRYVLQSSRAGQCLEPLTARSCRTNLRAKSRQRTRKSFLRLQGDMAAGRSVPTTQKLKQYVPKAIIFDCDGVLVESEELHRITYNETFLSEGLAHIQWSQDYYEVLQNQIGGGKEKYWYHFEKDGWPSPDQCGFDTNSQSGREALVQHLHTMKSLRYAERIQKDDTISLRPGVGEIIDAAQARGIRLAICSASNRESVHAVLQRVLGDRSNGVSKSNSRLEKFEFIIAGDSVPRKKPDPLIYQVALQRLGLQPADCLVIEDSAIGLRAALGAGIRCVITYTWYTKSQSFDAASAVFGELEGVSLDDILDAVTVSSR